MEISKAPTLRLKELNAHALIESLPPVTVTAQPRLNGQMFALTKAKHATRYASDGIAS